MEDRDKLLNDVRSYAGKLYQKAIDAHNRSNNDWTALKSLEELVFWLRKK